MTDINLSSLKSRVTGNIEGFVNDKIGGFTNGIESLLGTGFGPNLADQNFGKNRKQLKFPIDNQDQYEAFIRFKVKKIEPEQISVKSLVAAKKAAASSDNAAAPVESAFADDAAASDRRNRGQKNSRNQLRGSNSGKVMNPRRLIDGSFIDLYLPVALQFSDALEYEGVDLGRIGGAIEGSVKNGGSAMDTMGAMAKAGIAGFTDAFSGNISPEVARLAAVGIVGKASASAAGAIKSATRVTTNPNTRTVFKGVGIRTFSFTFSMIPTSVAEAQRIKDIVYLFRSEIYPEVIREAATGIPLGYIFPNVFSIGAHYKDKSIGFKYLDCYLTGMQTSFNPSSMTMMRDGNFQQTDISLSFTEMRALDKTDIWQGY